MATSFIGRSDLPIGLRNNNPGDLKTGIAWQGMTGAEGSFITFQDITWGLRALARDLVTNIDHEGINTIEALISKYAPPSENLTQVYIADVAADTGLAKDEVLGTDADTIHSLIRAIVRHELGDTYAQMVSDADIDTGIAMEGGGTLPQAAVIALENPAAYVATDTGMGIVAVLAAALVVWYSLKRDN